MSGCTASCVNFAADDSKDDKKEKLQDQIQGDSSVNIEDKISQSGVELKSHDHQVNQSGVELKSHDQVNQSAVQLKSHDHQVNQSAVQLKSHDHQVNQSAVQLKSHDHQVNQSAVQLKSHDHQVNQSAVQLKSHDQVHQSAVEFRSHDQVNESGVELRSHDQVNQSAVELKSHDLVNHSAVELRSHDCQVDQSGVELKSHDLDLVESEQSSDIKFNPPLYHQRYRRVTDVLAEYGVTSVADFGCAECKALRMFKELSHVTRLVGVDIDKVILMETKFRLKPLITDYLFRRPKPLSIELYCGSVLEWDERLRGVEAVTMIEVVEHLVLDDVDRLPQALFRVLSPRIVVMTTPNADFNVLFKRLSGFRHPDHKFEWTREEFQTWCNTAADLYGYTVRYEDIGDPPEGLESLGGCSQMAVFTRDDSKRPERAEQMIAGDNAASKKDEKTSESSLNSSPYELVYTVEYPMVNHLTEPSQDEKLLNEAIYYLNNLARSRAESEEDLTQDDSSESGGGEEEEGIVKMSLDDLMKYERVSCLCEGQVNRLGEVLEGAGYRVEGGVVWWMYEQGRHWLDDGSEEEGEEEGEGVEYVEPVDRGGSGDYIGWCSATYVMNEKNRPYRGDDELWD